ncbi:MAG: hypothetical protein ACI9EF_000599 [Pseudohongiellaceae bacterium]|jgi:hypothetical protein
MTSPCSLLQGFGARSFLPLLMVVACLAPASRSQVFPISLQPPVKLISLASSAGDQYGGAVATGADVIAIGAPFANGARGEVIIEEFNGTSFSETVTLAPLALPSGAQFGLELALDGDTLAVGAPEPTFPATGAGSVYVYLRNGSTWALQATLTPSAGQAGDQFGRGLALQDDRLIVGSPFDDDGGIQAGSAWVFERSGGLWAETAQLLATDASSGAQFGKSVALDNDTALVGAWLDSSALSQAGAGYVFVEAGGLWSEQAKLAAGAAAMGDNAGTCVGLEGDMAVLGAPLANSAAGAIFQFGRDPLLGVWTELPFTPPFSITAGDVFGTSLAFEEGSLLVGSPEENSQGTALGTVLFFVLDGQGVFQLDTEFDGSGAVGDRFGQSVSIGAGLLGIGVPFGNGGTFGSGAVMAVEKLTQGIWTSLGKSLDGTHGTPLFVGTGDLIEGSPFSLDLANSLENSLAALFIGFSEVCAPFHLGVLSPSPDFVIIVTTDGLGEQQFAGDWPTGHGGPFPVYLQWWVQDAGALAGWSASNAIEALTPPG